MSDPTRTHDDTISLLDLIAVIARRKWLIVAITGGVAVATVALILVMMVVPSTSPWNVLPIRFEPTAKILVEDPTKSSSLSSLMGQSGLGALSGLVGGSGGKATSAELAKALLASNGLRDAVIEEFGFRQRLDLERSQAPRMSARLAIGRATRAEFDEKTGILTVGFSDWDADLATRVVNRMVDLLDAEFMRLTVDKAGAKREYLEKSIAALETEAKKASDSLIAFQTRYGIVDFSAQASENTKAVVQLQSQITTKQMELDLQKKYLPESDSRIVKLKAERAGLQKLMTDLREGGGEYNSSQVSQKRAGDPRGAETAVRDGTARVPGHHGDLPGHRESRSARDASLAPEGENHRHRDCRGVLPLHSRCVHRGVLPQGGGRPCRGGQARRDQVLPVFPPKETAARQMTTFALQVCTGCEPRFLAAARRAAGARAVLLWPRRSLRIRRGGRWLASLAPVFPGYLFLQARDVDSGLYTDLRGIPGFLRFLPSNSAITPLSLKDQELLSQLTVFGEIIGASSVTFDANGRIRVAAGPLKGLEGNNVRVDRRKGRARVRLEMYEDSFEIDFGFEALEKAPRTQPAP